MAQSESLFTDSKINHSILYAESDEEETISKMIGGILRLPEFSASSLQQLQASEFTKLRNFASFVAEEEFISVKYRMHDGQDVEQKVLCISNGLVDLRP
jgi:hypothetical protein